MFKLGLEGAMPLVASTITETAAPLEVFCGEFEGSLFKRPNAPFKILLNQNMFIARSNGGTVFKRK